MEPATLVPAEPQPAVDRRRAAQTVRFRGVARHRDGTPGLRSYRNMVIDLDATGRRIAWRRARHLRRRVRRMAGSQWALALAAATTGILLLVAGWQAVDGVIAVAGILAP